MKIIKFCKTGQAVSDFNISNYVDGIVADTNMEGIFEISTHLVIDEIRARINENRISVDDFVFHIEDEYDIMHVIYFDENGRKSVWFKTEEIWDDIMIRLL